MDRVLIVEAADRLVERLLESDEVPVEKVPVKALKRILALRVDLKGNESRSDLVAAAKLIGLRMVKQATVDKHLRD